MHNLILTGIPRSGTTLAAATVDGAGNSLCLSEPRLHDVTAQCDDAAQFAAALVEKFNAIRRDVLEGIPVVDRRDRNGRAITNYFGPRRDDASEREEVFAELPIVRAGLTPDFMLGIKHNGLFLSALPQIVAAGFFRVVGIVRNPIETIRSWQSLTLPISNARMPGTEKYWPQLRQAALEQPNLLDAQLAIYSLLVWRLRREGVALVRYEDFRDNPRLLLPVVEGATDILESSDHGRMSEQDELDFAVVRWFRSHRDYPGAPDVTELYPSTAG
jgi:hypothetical protein